LEKTISIVKIAYSEPAENQLVQIKEFKN